MCYDALQQLQGYYLRASDPISWASLMAWKPQCGKKPTLLYDEL